MCQVCVFVCVFVQVPGVRNLWRQAKMMASRVMYARCVFLCAFLCKYLGLGTSGERAKMLAGRLCMPGCVFVCVFVCLCEYLGLGTPWRRAKNVGRQT